MREEGERGREEGIYAVRWGGEERGRESERKGGAEVHTEG